MAMFPYEEYDKMTEPERMPEPNMTNAAQHALVTELEPTEPTEPIE